MIFYPMINLWPSLCLLRPDSWLLPQAVVGKTRSCTWRNIRLTVTCHSFTSYRQPLIYSSYPLNCFTNERSWRTRYATSSHIPLLVWSRLTPFSLVFFRHTGTPYMQFTQPAALSSMQVLRDNPLHSLGLVSTHLSLAVLPQVVWLYPSLAWPHGWLIVKLKERIMMYAGIRTHSLLKVSFPST